MVATAKPPKNRIPSTNGHDESNGNGKSHAVVRLPELDIREFTLDLEGVSSLVVHNFSDKNKKQIEDKQQKKAKVAKEARDPKAEYLASLYTMDGSPATGKKTDRYGIPSIGFKKACVSACRFVDGITMTAAKCLFFIYSEDGGDMIPLDGTPQMRTDMVRIGQMKDIADIRYRAEFLKWRVKVLIRYNSSSVSPEQIVNLFHHAGFHVGWGEMRPEKGGHSHGQWKVVQSSLK